MPLCLSSTELWVFEESPDAAGEEALDASSGFAFGLALGDSAGDVGLGVGVAAPFGDRHHVQGPVELSVAAAVEPVAGLVLAGGGRHGCGASESCEGCFAVTAAGMAPGDVAVAAASTRRVRVRQRVMASNWGKGTRCTWELC